MSSEFAGRAPAMRVGTSADNALAESFLGLFKRDLAHAVRVVPRSEAMVRINDYIVNLQNPLRRAAWRRVLQIKLAVTDASATENEQDFFRISWRRAAR